MLRFEHADRLVGHAVMIDSWPREFVTVELADPELGHAVRGNKQTPVHGDNLIVGPNTKAEYLCAIAITGRTVRKIPGTETAGVRARIAIIGEGSTVTDQLKGWLTVDHNLPPDEWFAGNVDDENNHGPDDLDSPPGIGVPVR